MEPGQGNFPRKHLQRVDLSITPERLNQIISDIKSQIEPVGTILDYSKMFMPDMSKRVQLVVEDNDPFYVYKINVPGFIYRQHVAGDWDAECGIRVLVSNRTTFNKAYLYLDTKGAPVNANDHGNNLFPVRPGDSTYMIFSKYNKDDNMNVYFVPALGTVYSTNGAVTRLNPISYPSTILPGALTDSDYLSCFASANDIPNSSYERGSNAFPSGLLACAERSATDESNRIIQSLDELLKSHPVKAGELPSVFPDMSSMQVMNDSIYRVNTVGYFYRHIKSAKTTAGSKSGIVLAPTLANMEILDVGVYSNGENRSSRMTLCSGTEVPDVTTGFTKPTSIAVPAQAKIADVASNTGRVNYVVMTGNDRFGGTCVNMIPIVPGAGTTGTGFGGETVHSGVLGTGIYSVQRTRGTASYNVTEHIYHSSSVNARINALKAADPLMYDNFSTARHHKDNHCYYLYYTVYNVSYVLVPASDTESYISEGEGTFVYFYHDNSAENDQYFFIPSKCVTGIGVNPISEIHSVQKQFTYGLKSKTIGDVAILSTTPETGVALQSLAVAVESNRAESEIVEFFNKCFTNSKHFQNTPFVVFVHNLKEPNVGPTSSSAPKYLYESLESIAIFDPKTQIPEEEQNENNP